MISIVMEKRNLSDTHLCPRQHFVQRNPSRSLFSRPSLQHLLRLNGRCPVPAAGEFFAAGSGD